MTIFNNRKMYKKCSYYNVVCNSFLIFSYVVYCRRERLKQDSSAEAKVKLLEGRHEAD